MSRLLIIGCGGVASVAVHKCCQNSEVFTEIMIASRTVSKCEALKAELEGKTSTKITTAKAGRSIKPGSSLPGSDHHGRLLKGRSQLH